MSEQWQGGLLFKGVMPRRDRGINVAGVRGRGRGISFFPCAVLNKYASGPVPRDGCPVARPSPRSRFGVSCIMRASRMLKNSSIKAHHVQVCMGDLSQAGRFGKAA